MELSSSNTRVVMLAAAVAVVAAVAGVMWFLGDDQPEAPAAWAPEVTELASFVERARGIAFVDPVRVEALDEEQYLAAVGAADGSMSDADRQRALELVVMLRALGLVDDRADDDALVEQAIEVTLASGPPARYLPQDRRVVVRASGLDSLSWQEEAALVAALGTALHDQHLGVSRASRLDRSASAVGLRAVSGGVGDALAVQYVTEVVEEDARSWREFRDTGRGTDAVDLVRAMAMLPEDLGEPLVQVSLVDATSGDGTSWSLVTSLFTSPPRTELELLQPWAAIDGFERVGVAAPEPDEGHEVLVEGGFGAASLYLVAALRADAREALAAALVWAGDAAILTRDPDGRACIKVATVGRDGDASDRIEEVLREWVAAAPTRGDAAVERDGRTVLLRSCDPGRGAGTGIVLDPATAVSVPVSRTDLLAELRGGGASRANAVCQADLVLAGIPVAALTDTDRPPEADTLYAILREESEQACRRVA